MHQPTRNSQPMRRVRRPVASRAATRERLTYIIISLFISLCLLAVVVPASPLLDRLLPIAAQALLLVLSYYFTQRERG